MTNNMSKSKCKYISTKKTKTVRRILGGDFYITATGHHMRSSFLLARPEHQGQLYIGGEDGS